jgi:hypothetical protein
MKKRKIKALQIRHPSKKCHSASPFKVAVARAQGRRHESADIPCQDAVSGFCSDKLASIVLADGAGSALYAGPGAEIVVNTITGTLKENFNRIIRSKEAKAKHKVMGPLIRTLSEVSKRYRTELKQFAATLLFAATDGKKLLIGQLGDGRIGIRNAVTGEWRSILSASKGEFFNETVFVTSRNAPDLLQLSVLSVDSTDACVIMSDGAEESLYQRASGIFAPAVSRMSDWVPKYDRTTLESAIENNLKDVIRLKTSDDVSIGYLVY